jgi:hypothetical protein
MYFGKYAFEKENKDFRQAFPTDIPSSTIVFNFFALHIASPGKVSKQFFDAYSAPNGFTSKTPDGKGPENEFSDTTNVCNSGMDFGVKM